MTFGGSHDQDRSFTAELADQPFSDQPFSFPTQHAREENANLSQPALLLRAGNQRPHRRGTAEPRDECAPVHSITSSARARSDGGTVRSSILAVSALMTSSNLDACTTGKSVGLAPLRMRPV